MKPLHSLQFDQQLFTDHQIESMHKEPFSPIHDWHWLLTLELHAMSFELIASGAMVDRLDQTRPELPMDRNAASDHLANESLEIGTELRRNT